MFQITYVVELLEYVQVSYRKMFIVYHHLERSKTEFQSCSFIVQRFYFPLSPPNRATLPGIIGVAVALV